MNLREHTYYLLEPGDGTGRIIAFSIVILIFLNVLALIFETVEPIYRLNRSAFEAFENFSLVVFFIEYLLRLWSCTTNPRYAHPVKGRLHFFFSFFGLIDLLAILPFFLPAVGIDLRFVRTVRLLRIFRIVKLVRYSRAPWAKSSWTARKSY